jgi:hypothetical protein
VLPVPCLVPSLYIALPFNGSSLEPYTYIHTCMHTYIHIYIYTYIHPLSHFLLSLSFFLFLTLYIPPHVPVAPWRRRSNVLSAGPTQQQR